ncbi:glycosyltransferase [Egicoccus halophilus]|uniref:glycosyltransferase n=1 Tax=Egicoccus halophilus TaxID=1670830 RepID=UPI001E6500D1|nr:glycosyltransferase [Egicoccus halophilus]
MRRIAMLSVHTSPLDQPGTGDGGGLNVTVREQALRLARRGVEVEVFTRWADPQLPPTVSLADGVRVHHVEAGPRAPVDKHVVANHLCAFVLAAQRHPTAGTYDVLHAHYWLSGWVGRRLAERWSTPLVQTFHTLGVLKNATLAPGDRPEPALRLVAEERVANEADRVLALTCGEARLLHRTYGLSGARMTVVPAGVDLDRFRTAPDRVFPRFDGPDAPAPRLLFVGRLQPLKGPDVAVRTLAEVRRRHPRARLRIVGGASGAGQVSTGPDQLRALADRLGVADGLDLEPAVDQDTLAERYRAADVLLAPSRSETFGLVALEAQACGVPVVAADVPGLEAVVAGGGTLVPGHDPVDHARAVCAYLDDPARRRQTADAGRRTADAASWDRAVDRLLSVYGELAGARAELAV